ncbi:MAG: quinone-dependent dihydroorotate dehydrogenase [Deltaproteobacteria bacterium]|nr:quinone-dependent dihydroorotate dehydrogenase [Deltaproteobacteria bacterium]
MMKQPFYIKNILFRLEPEKAHHLVLSKLEFLKNISAISRIFKKKYFYTSPALRSKIGGLDFINPVGLASGFDKNGIVDHFFEALGFGFYELGTVTLNPQQGHSGKRIWRFPDQLALVNRMGFPNDGVDALKLRIESKSKHVIRGISIGKNRTTSLEEASSEYARLISKVFSCSDYFSVNISSPNTENLAELGHLKYFKKFLDDIDQANAIEAKKYQVLPKPIFIKVSPDTDDKTLFEMMGQILERKNFGVIATNTTTNRNLFSAQMPEEGGLSGKPLADLSTKMISKIYKLTQGKIPIIGCGGIFSVADALEKIKAGASLLQIYTGFVYSGPKLIREINRGIDEEVSRLGLNHYTDLIGQSRVTGAH